MIAALVLFAIVSMGSISAAEDISEDVINQDVDDVVAEEEEVVLTDGEGTDATKTIQITTDMEEEQIQETFNNLENNTVINFQSGTFNINNLTVKGDKDGNRLGNIKFIGNGATLTGKSPAKKTDSPANMTYYFGIFELNKIDGFTITGFNFKSTTPKGATPMTPSCVVISNCTNGVISENDFQGGRFGLYVGNKKNDFGPAPTSNITIEKNTVSNVGDMGIISFGASKTKILNNTIINPANHGIDVRFPAQGFTNVTVKGNYITGAKEAIYIMHSAGHIITENIINSSVIGVTCYGSNDVSCINNIFANNTKIGYFLGAGYANISIEETADSFTGLFQTKMPPTFPYYIVKSDSAYTQALSGVFSDLADTHMTYIEALMVNDEFGTLVDMSQGANTIIGDDLLPYNKFLTFKVWKYDDRNHIDAGETISVTVDKATTNLTSDTGGAVFFDISKLSKGIHTLTVFYGGNEELEPCTWTGTFQLGSSATPISTLIDTSITASDITATAKIAKNFILTLKDANGILANKKVSVTVNGKTTTVNTDAKGQATIKTNFAAAGTYYYTLCFLGDEDYKASLKAVKVTVNKQAVKATFKKATLKVKKAKKVKFTLKDANGKAIAGKKITVKVNGKTFSAKTNSKGVASIKVKVAKKGTFKAVAKFAGDNTYKAISKKATFKVKK